MGKRDRIHDLGAGLLGIAPEEGLALVRAVGDENVVLRLHDEDGGEFAVDV